MNKENIKFLNESNIIYKNQLEILLDLAIAEDEILKSIIENIKISNLVNPFLNNCKEDICFYVLTNKKIFMVEILVNREYIKIYPLMSFYKIVIERDRTIKVGKYDPANDTKQYYGSIDRIKKFEIIFNGELSLIFDFNLIKDNKYYDIATQKKSVLSFIKELYKLI